MIFMGFACLVASSCYRYVPMAKAAVRGDLAAARKLAAEDPASVNQGDKYGLTPLMFAAMEGKPEVAAFLVQSGADVNAADMTGTTALSFACGVRYEVGLESYMMNVQRLDVAAILIDGGAKVDARDKNGETPLITAAWNRAGECVELLLERGADVNAKTSEGLAPLFAAVSSGSLLNPDIDTIRLLLEKGADVNAKTSGGMTPLMASAYSDLGEPDIAIMSLLLDREASINDRQTGNGFSALTLAATWNNLAGAKLLISKGADLAVRDNDGKTLLQLIGVVVRSSGGLYGIVTTRMDYKDMINYLNESGAPAE